MFPGTGASHCKMPRGTNDFSKADLKDFDDWLTMAEQYGFYIIVRPGPYICAEWDNGGYPQWLLTEKETRRPPVAAAGMKLRSDDPVYPVMVQTLVYDAVCPVIARHQITRKEHGQPGVISSGWKMNMKLPQVSRRRRK